MAKTNNFYFYYDNKINRETPEYKIWSLSSFGARRGREWQLTWVFLDQVARNIGRQRLIFRLIWRLG